MSPDFSLIKKLWNEVDRFLASQKFNNLNNLFNAVQQAWVLLPKKLLKNLSESLSRRYKILFKNYLIC